MANLSLRRGLDFQERVVFETKIQTDKFERISLPVVPLIFSDYQPENERLSVIEGLRKYGPYDLNTSDASVRRNFNGVEFFVYYPQGENLVYNRLSRLISMLRNGYFERRCRRDVDFGGFEREFRVKAFIPDPKDFCAYTPGRLSDELNDLRDELDDILKRENRPIVIVGGTSHKSTRRNREQYLEAKREFTKIDYPCQYASFYEQETGGAGILYILGSRNQPFGFSLWNFALNIYGKIGGLAWIVRQKLNESLEKMIDLTIGLRFVRTSMGAAYKVGYAIVLDRFGKLIGVTSSEPFKATIEEETRSMIVPSIIMKEMVIKALNLALNDPRTKHIFQEKKDINLAFHRPSLFYPEEVYGIKSALEEYESIKFKYGLISIVSRSPLLFFKRSRDRFLISRGEAFVISENTVILQTTNPLTRISYPILVQLQNLNSEDCPFNDLKELCNHIMALSNLHWQTIVSGSIRLPASLEFAHNIAFLTANGIIPKDSSWLWQTLWFI